MKYILFILGVLLLPLTTYSQELQEVIYLKNGSIIRGTIIEQVPGKTIRIETPDGSLFVYQMDEVEKITKEPSKTIEKNPSKTGNQYVGYVFVGASPTIGEDDREGVLFSMTTIHGVTISSNAYLGIGSGYEVLSNGTSQNYLSVKLIPIFADCRFFFTQSSLKPYVFGDVGYSFGKTLWPDVYQEEYTFSSQGALYFFGIGGSYSDNRSIGINIEIGYHGQELKVGRMDMIGMRLGVSF